MNPEYKPVRIFGHLFKIDGRQVYYHAGRDEYSIERDYADGKLFPLNCGQRDILHNAFVWEKAELDAADALDDASKRMSGHYHSAPYDIWRLNDDD